MHTNTTELKWDGKLSKVIQSSLNSQNHYPGYANKIPSGHGSEQQEAFDKIKSAITTLPVLTYFDKNKDHINQTDALKTGLGAVLLQDGQPVVYVSRALTDTECRYSQH